MLLDKLHAPHQDAKQHFRAFVARFGPKTQGMSAEKGSSPVIPDQEAYISCTTQHNDRSRNASLSIARSRHLSAIISRRTLTETKDVGTARV